MKTFLKVLAIVAATLAVVIVIALVVIIHALPSPAEVGRYLKPSTAKAALKQPEIAKAQTLPAAVGSPATDPSAAPEIKKDDVTFNIKGDTEEEKKLLDDMMNPQKPLAEFCNYLRNAPQSNIKGYSFSEFGKKFKESVMTENKDPVVQAIKPTLRYVMQQPQLQELIRQAQEAADKGESDGLMQKAGFYKQVYGAYSELTAHKTQVEHVMDRSYHLMMMAKVIAQKPELLSDNHINDYCHAIESAINGDTQTSWDEEKNEFGKFLSDSGVDPKSIGYDPNYRTKLNITYGAAGLKMQGGWIDSILKPSPEEIRAYEAQAKKENAANPTGK